MRVAAVDIGTNTVRLLITDGDTELLRRVDVVGLGRGARDGMLAGDSMRRALAVLAEYGSAAAEHGVAAALAVATAATRDAVNGPEFLERAAASLGFRAQAISGEKEASLSFAGAAAAFPGGGSTLVIDPGGGSTEFLMDEPPVAVSVPIGSVRLTERLLPDRPASPSQVEAASGAVAAQFAAVPLAVVPERVVGVAGTFTTLAAISTRTPYPGRVHGTTLLLGDLDSMVGVLSGLSVAETAAIPYLDPARAPVILAGAVVAAEAVRRSGREPALVSERDLLDALAAELLQRALPGSGIPR